MLNRSLSVLSGLLLALVLLGGCASSGQTSVSLYYPDAPEDPRISYVASYRGLTDFRRNKFLDALFGAPTGITYRQPFGVAASGDRIYVTSAARNSTYVVDRKKEAIEILGFDDPQVATLPMGITTTADGRVYVTDPKQKKIFTYDASGKFQFQFANKDEFVNIVGLAVNNELGRLYVVDSLANAVFAYSLKGEKLFRFGARGEGDGEFFAPTSAAVDRRNGNLYVVDSQNFRMQVFDKDGKYLRKFGELGDAPGSFARPKGVAVDSEGHVYVSDAAFDNIQIFDDQGKLLLAFGSAGMGPGFFQIPTGLFMDSQDRLYVADSLNHRIQVFQYLSEAWKKAHPVEYQKILDSRNQPAEAALPAKGAK